jgi:aryl-alcohol dehydrogenase-like predicted oxidoreductase
MQTEERPHALPQRLLGRSGLRVSALGLGGAGLGGAYGEITDDQAVEAVQAALGGGVTYIDTSPLYRESERRIGLALKGIDRARIVLSTKTGSHPSWPKDYSADATFRTVESSLRLLGTDYLDLLLVHDPPDLTRALGPAGAVEALEALKRQGVIKAIGLGVYSDALHREAILSGRIDVVMTYLEYTLVHAAAAGTIFPLAAEHQVGIINGSPLAMGLLSGMDPDRYLREVLQWVDDLQLRDVGPARRLWLWAREHGIPLVALALQFSMRNQRVGSTIVGAKTAAEVRQDIEAATMNIPDEIWTEVQEMMGIPL